MARWKVDDELRGEQPAGTFQPFKNGKLNLKTPKGYNWATGVCDIRKDKIVAKYRTQDVQLPLSTINGQRCRT